VVTEHRAPSLPASELGAARGRRVIDRGVDPTGVDAVGLGSVLVTFGNAKSWNQDAH
jgi:hypothetical protein